MTLSEWWNRGKNPAMDAANLIALIIFFAEVATGWAIYRSGERQSRSPAARSAGAGFLPDFVR